MDIDAFPELMLTIAAEREPTSIFQIMVRGLAGCPQVVLTRVWVLGPGDVCGECRMRRECPDQSRCLHLVASAGNPLDAGRDYTRTRGAFRRFPLGVRKIGRVASTGQSLILSGLSSESEWVARPEWIEEEEVSTMAAQPLIYAGEVLGVLAVFHRQRLNEEQFRWLRIFADHAAIALANARAFAEIEKLSRRLRAENDLLREEAAAAAPAPGDIVGTSTAIQAVLEQVHLVAPTDATVLVHGESGTGKELIARAIHEGSPRASRPLVKVNCGAIPENLFESEFFGHVRGSFTGAVKDRAGRFEVADGGTLFLDEVGEIPLGLQAKLLRVLQEGTFERVGEERTRKVDVRVIAATNRELEQEILAGRFREDLFYRLNVFPIVVPPLRERPEDIPALAEHFLDQAVRRLGRGRLRIPATELARLQSYPWPGNVRELQHVMERAVILAGRGPLRVPLPEPRPPTRGPDPHPGFAPVAPTPPAQAPTSTAILTRDALRAQERASIESALRASGGKIFGPDGAAEILRMKPTTLASRIRALGITR